MLNDRKMSMKIKGKVYRTVVRTALVYGEETWVSKRAYEIKWAVAEIGVGQTNRG